MWRRARVRYWRYDHSTETLDTNDDIAFDFTTIDGEATTRLQFNHTEITLAGGFRYFDGQINHDGTQIETKMPGLTFAADLRGRICGDCCNQWSTIGGARWSILGGDWEGNNNAFLPRSRDDNMVVEELYAGVEYSCRQCNGAEFFARLMFELQNWHSDVMAQNTLSDSVGFVGPGVTVGARFELCLSGWRSRHRTLVETLQPRPASAGRGFFVCLA